MDIAAAKERIPFEQFSAPADCVHVVADDRYRHTHRPQDGTIVLAFGIQTAGHDRELCADDRSSECFVLAMFVLMVLVVVDLLVTGHVIPDVSANHSDHGSEVIFRTRIG